MSSTNAVPVAPSSNGKPTRADICFLTFLVILMVAVAGLGRMTFREGLKTETTKAQAESLMDWMKQASALRSTSEDFRPTDCAVRVAGTSSPMSWANCATAIFADGGALARARNAFTEQPLQILERCIPGDSATVGHLVVEKLVPTPPGSAIPVVISPLAGDDRIDQRLQLRIQVCDKGGYAIRVGETDF